MRGSGAWAPNTGGQPEGWGSDAALAWEGLQGAHEGLRVRLEDAGRPPGLRPRARPLPLPGLPAASPARLRLFYFRSHPPPPRNTDTIPPFSPLTPSSPALLLAARGCPGSLPLPRPPPRPVRPAPSEDTAASSPRIRLFSFLSSFLLTPPSSPRGASASKRGQPRNQRWRLQEGQLETVLKGLNFPPKFILELN